MTLSTRLIAVHEVPAGATVGYGETWTATRPSVIAVAAVGYADGYPRSASSGTPVVVNGRRYPLVGRVSMDMITVDVTEGPRPGFGDEVELWGRSLPVETIASSAGTIGYELLCRVAPRVKFEFI